MKRFILLFFIMLIAGCVSIERDVYFKDLNSQDEKTLSASRPGSQFRSKPIDISSVNKTSIDDDSNERTIVLSISNYAAGSYLWGIIVPIVPVFYLPSMHFNLVKNEPLRVQCQIIASYGPRYLERWKSAGSRDLYMLNKKGIEVAEKMSLKKDSCVSISLTLPDGTELLPSHVEFNEESYQTTFVFNTMATDLNIFKINVAEIRIDSSKKLNVNVTFQAALEDWTRYYLVPVAP
ncbi:MAG TPA: hypothetical protein VF412_02380 [Bdellovibrio sp.]|uniref:hypothetical protein n=1 Tax=Bdellovibrio sp. TaxID=28201 RepID=UPI002EFA0665